MEHILAVDGGGSRTRCLAITRDGKIVGGAESGPSNHLLVDGETVRRSLDVAVNEAMANAGIERSDIARISAGLAGVDYDGRGSDEMTALFRDLGFENVIINGDMVIAHAGALAGKPGVLALAGTGSAILGVGDDGARAKVGGWGPIFGDEGSAYGIAQNCLRAAARSFDGRGKKTALLHAVTTSLGVDSFDESLTRVYLDEMEPREIAALARTCYPAAESGDHVAVSIFRQAGDELAEAVASAIRRLDTANPKVSYQGSVLESCAIVLEQFKKAVKTEFPNACITEPRFKPVIGAFLIGCKEAGWNIEEMDLSGLENVPFGA
ncbi:MAG TPA: BadF/BadG/BcrA/BcrD ATPase family protein [Pyrinomonadaceae bacterium]|nr:BadF/BadG/BcrA/BcrD ATPase family protein [Pyrinomonadaceae bacterium]